jgi:uncharacterized protein YdaU (DUF1376 family)
MHYFQFNIGDYASHTRHLDLIEDLAYRRLLDLYYLHERPLNTDATVVAKQIGMRDNAAAVRDVLNEFFDLTADGYRSARADKEIEHYHSKIQQASRAGKASAERRMNGRSTVASTDVRTDVQPTNNQEPITKNQQTNSVSKDTGVKTPMSPDEIIFGYGVPLLTNAGVADKQARSFLGGLRKTHGDDALVNTLRECIRAKPLQPLEWLAAALPPAGIKPKLNKQEALEASNRAVVDRLLKKEGLA